jgi:hypothetical protein
MINAASSLRRSVWALAIVTALSPIATFAATATPQQITDANLQRLSTTQPASVSGEVKINVTEKPVKKTESSSSGSVSFHFNSRTVPSGNAVPNTEGDLSITSFESSGMGVSIPTLTNPGSLEWKSINGTSYLRVTNIANTISSFLSAAGVKVDTIIGTWLKLDPSSLPACSSMSTCGTAAMVASQTQKDLSTIMKSPVRITRTEKKWKAANGDMMVRVRGIINPTMISGLQNREIKAVSLKDKQRAAKIKDINARYTELRKVTGAIQLALNINQTDKTIERAEIGVTQNQPTKVCTTNKWKMTSCKTTSNTKTNLLIGLNFAPGKSDAIVAPSSALTVDDLIKLLK